MSKKCHHNEVYLYKAEKKMTDALGNASSFWSGNLNLTLNPCAKPFIQPLRVKHSLDLLTLDSHKDLELGSKNLSFWGKEDVVKTRKRDNDLSMRTKFNSIPLRLNGGGDTSLEYHGNLSSECQGNVSSISSMNEIGEIRLNDMPWENTMISDTSSTTPSPQDVSTPTVTINESTLSSPTELNPMADHFFPLPTNLNPLADPFIPLLPEFSFSDTNLSESTGNVSSSDGNDPLSLLTGLKENKFRTSYNSAFEY